MMLGVTDLVLQTRQTDVCCRPNWCLENKAIQQLQETEISQSGRYFLLLPTALAGTLHCIAPKMIPVCKPQEALR